MLNPDIVGGLKSALTRGYSLDEAMMSFLNAGYKREEIEEASQSLQSQITSGEISSELSPQPIWTLEQDNQDKQIEPEVITAPKQKQAIPKEKFQVAQPKQVVTRGVAAYTDYDTSRIRTITVILAILLVLLVGILGLMYIFKNQIIDFLNGVF